MSKSVKVNLLDRDTILFERIKTHVGIRADTDVIRHLITYYGRREGLIPPIMAGMDLKNTEPKEAKTE